MTIACIQEAIGLFQSNTCAASAIAATSFVAGALVAFAAAKIFCPCAKRRAASPKRRDARPEKRHAAPADGSVEIYVGNLSYDLSEDQLRKEFEAYGKVNSARIIANRYNNRSKGFGFVQMPVRAEAEAAVAALNDKEILGRRLKCNEAKNLA